MAKRYKLNTPYPSTRKDKKLMVFVKNPETGRINRIHFGQVGYRHNYSKKSWRNYRKRSAAITDKKGKPTKDNKMSANYWARKILWSGNKWRRR